MQMIKETSKKAPENGKQKKEGKQAASAAKQQKRKRTSNKEEGESSSDEEEEGGEEVNVEDIEVGARFFTVEKDVPYPAIVNKLPGTKHSKALIQDETCYMHYRLSLHQDCQLF
jgi:hypothetical protein